MNCTIPGSNLKVVIKAVQALSKIGDELHIDAKKEHLSFIAVNMNKTVFTTFDFKLPFFTSYDPGIVDPDSEDNTCHMNIKFIMSVFKQLKEKNVEFVNMQLDQANNKFIMKIKIKGSGVLLVHRLYLIDFEMVTIADMNSINSTSQIIASAGFFDKLLNMFSLSDAECNLEITANRMVARNYSINTSSLAKIIRTEVKLHPGEFNAYRIKENTNMMFTLRPFRALVGFAKNFNMNITINFETGGRPMVLMIKSPTFDVTFILSSLDPDSATQTTTTTAITNKRNLSNTGDRANITMEDREALSIINWDDDFNVPPKRAKDNEGSEVLQKSDAVDVEDVREKDLNKSDLDKRSDDVISSTPDSPRTKRLKIVFERCFEKTFDVGNLGEVLVPNSDSESDNEQLR